MKRYEKPSLTIVLFGKEDVIRASVGDGADNDPAAADRSWSFDFLAPSNDDIKDE